MRPLRKRAGGQFLPGCSRAIQAERTDGEIDEAFADSSRTYNGGDQDTARPNSMSVEPKDMRHDFAEISVNGSQRVVPAAIIDGKTVVVTSSYIKIAVVKDEEYLEGDSIKSADAFIETLKRSGLKADILCFAQKPVESRPKYSYYTEWDNAAIIPIKSASEWWEERLPQETRRNVRRAAKLGITVKSVEFNDELVRGIESIYNETPVRQGKGFWHYGKDFDTVKKENATYLDRSEFIGAYFENELVGFVKLVYVDRTASIMQILSKNAHHDKRPTNALIAKAVEISAQRGMAYLMYCKYVYGKNDKSDLTEFKRRNGFEQLLYPRYYVPLGLKGRIILWLKLHQGFSRLVPKRLWPVLVNARAKFYEIARRRKPVPRELKILRVRV